MCGPSRIGDQHPLWLRVRDRFSHPFADGERCGSERRGVESLFNTNRFAQLVFDERTDDGRQRWEHWFVAETLSERSGRGGGHECCAFGVHSNHVVRGAGCHVVVVVVIVGPSADACLDFRPEHLEFGVARENMVAPRAIEMQGRAGRKTGKGVVGVIGAAGGGRLRQRLLVFVDGWQGRTGGRRFPIPGESAHTVGVVAWHGPVGGRWCLHAEEIGELVLVVGAGWDFWQCFSKNYSGRTGGSSCVSEDVGRRNDSTGGSKARSTDESRGGGRRDTSGTETRDDRNRGDARTEREGGGGGRGDRGGGRGRSRRSGWVALLVQPACQAPEETSTTEERDHGGGGGRRSGRRGKVLMWSGGHEVILPEKKVWLIREELGEAGSFFQCGEHWFKNHEDVNWKKKRRKDQGKGNEPSFMFGDPSEHMSLRRYQTHRVCRQRHHRRYVGGVFSIEVERV